MKRYSPLARFWFAPRPHAKAAWSSAVALACALGPGCVNGEADPGDVPVGGQSSAGAPSVAGAPGQAGSASVPGQGGTGTAGRPSTVAGAPSTPGSSGATSGGASGVAGSAPRAGASFGGSSSSGAPNDAGGSSGVAGSAQAGSMGVAGSNSGSGFSNPMFGGQGQSSDRYHKAAVTRNGKNYYFMANGWGPGFQSQSVSWNGTSFTVVNMQGQQGGGYEPASYPTVFCGVYSDSRSGECGLPKALNEISSIRTGWRWKPNGNSGQYNVAYDVWMGNGTNIQSHASFLMVWLRDPPGQQPAGMPRMKGLQVANVSGSWDLWVGTVGGKPCISYTRPEGQDSLELEFDVMDFVKDVQTRGVQLPGSHVLSVAVGFEIWNGPINNLVSEDFYVDVR